MIILKMLDNQETPGKTGFLLKQLNLILLLNKLDFPLSIRKSSSFSYMHNTPERTNVTSASEGYYLPTLVSHSYDGLVTVVAYSTCVTVHRCKNQE